VPAHSEEARAGIEVKRELFRKEGGILLRARHAGNIAVKEEI
jgi:hypothetical protein